MGAQKLDWQISEPLQDLLLLQGTALQEPFQQIDGASQVLLMVHVLPVAVPASPRKQEPKKTRAQNSKKPLFLKYPMPIAGSLPEFGLGCKDLGSTGECTPTLAGTPKAEGHT
jgi:hypothetical protein